MSTCSVKPLTQAQLQTISLNAGFDRPTANLMAAIAMAESGGCPTATNPTDNGGKQTSWGIWQISDGTHNQPANWSDPQTNANMAFRKYQSQGLNAWGSYTTGKYKPFLNSRVTLSNTTPQSVADAQQQAMASGGASWQAQLQQMASSVGEHIAVFMIALVLIIVGVVMLSQKDVGSVVKKVIP